MPSAYQPSIFGAASTTAAKDHFRVEHIEPMTLVTITTSDLFHQKNTQELNDELLGVLKSERPDRLVINFENVHKFSTEVITTLLRVKRQVSTHAGKVALCSMSDQHREVFLVIDPHQSLFPIFSTVAEAWEWCK